MADRGQVRTRTRGAFINNPNNAAQRQQQIRTTVVHQHLRQTYDRMIEETMRRLKQQGRVSTAVLDELEDRWRKNVGRTLTAPQDPNALQPLSGPPIKKTRRETASGLINDPGFDAATARRKLQEQRKGRPTLYTPMNFQQKLKEPLPAKVETPAIKESKSNNESSSEDEYGDLMDDGETVEIGVTAAHVASTSNLVEVRDEPFSSDSDSDMDKTKEVEVETPEVPVAMPELSRLDDVADADAGSALGSDLDSDAWSEPEISDHIFASKIEIKNRKNGLWHVKLFNGICKINNEETLFKYADASFQFDDSYDLDDKPLV